MIMLRLRALSFLSNLANTTAYQKKYRGIPGITVLFHSIYRGQNFEYRPTPEDFGVGWDLDRVTMCKVNCLGLCCNTQL